MDDHGKGHGERKLMMAARRANAAFCQRHF